MKKIKVFCSMNKFFWVKNSKDILTLRNQFRITGNLIKVPFVNSKINFFLFLSLVEILIGLELGFMTIKLLDKNKRHIYDYLLGNSANKFYPQKSVLNMKISKKRNYVIKSWREIVDVLTKICLFRFKKKIFYVRKSNKMNPFNKLHQSSYKYIVSPIYFQELLKNFSEYDFLKYAVFKNLWQRGFYLTCGIKFGCCFLAYAGNIVDVHSYISVLAIPFNSNFISPKLIIAFGRTGTITKKFSILVSLTRCCFIKFNSLRWHNFLP